MSNTHEINRRRWLRDCSLALHQRLCWLICALAAVAGALAILRFSPDDLSVYFTVALALLLMGVYQYLAKAPQRVLNDWMALRAQGAVSSGDALKYILLMEKALPSMKKKEMAYSLTCAKGVLLFESGHPREAMDLLQNFRQIWDEAQREHIHHLIEKMQAMMNEIPHREEE